MNKYRHSKTSLFLMELMLNILFFSVLATICLQLFFKAHKLSEDTTILHRAVTTSTSIAEVYQCSPHGKDAVLHIYPDAVELNQNIILYFDENFASCPKEKSTYRALLTLAGDEISSAIIEFSRLTDNKVIYTLTTASYEPQSVGRLYDSCYQTKTTDSGTGGDVYE